MRKWSKRLAIALVVIYTGAFLVGIPPWYTFEPFAYRVVDAQSGNPIEGVVVVANWEYESGSFGGGNVSLGRAHLAEQVTDKDGWFRFEGFSRLNLSLKEMRDSDPQLILYKPGYQYLSLYNGFAPGVSFRGPIRKPQHITGNTIVFEKAAYPERHVPYQPGLSTDVRRLFGNCGWQKMPRMLIAMNEEHVWVRQNYKDVMWTGLIPFAHLPRDEKCGTPEEFLRDYMR